MNTLGHGTGRRRRQRRGIVILGWLLAAALMGLGHSMGQGAHAQETAAVLPPGEMRPDAHHDVSVSGSWFGAKTAIGGADPVAYFTEGRMVKGRDDITLTYLGAVWRFASAENRDRFKADPERYLPQYGGHCAWAAAHGKAAPGNPKFWRIVDGKLYLNFNAKTQKQWEQDIPGFIARADRHWRSPEGLR